MKLSNHLTPRLIETIQGWGSCKRQNNYWSKNDSEINLLLEALKKEMLNETYKNNISGK